MQTRLRPTCSSAHAVGAVSAWKPSTGTSGVAVRRLLMHRRDLGDRRHRQRCNGHPARAPVHVQRAPGRGSHRSGSPPRSSPPQTLWTLQDAPRLNALAHRRQQRDRCQGLTHIPVRDNGRVPGGMPRAAAAPSQRRRHRRGLRRLFRRRCRCRRRHRQLRGPQGRRQTRRHGQHSGTRRRHHQRRRLDWRPRERTPGRRTR